MGRGWQWATSVRLGCGEIDAGVRWEAGERVPWFVAQVPSVRAGDVEGTARPRVGGRVGGWALLCLARGLLACISPLPCNIKSPFDPKSHMCTATHLPKQHTVYGQQCP